MTQSEVIRKLRQVRDLERLIAAIEAHGAAGEWHTGLWALREQEAWLRRELSMESSLMLDMAAEIVNATPCQEPAVKCTLQMPDLPKGARVH